MSTTQTNPGLADRLRGLTLRPRQDLEVSRHVFGGKVTYILRDPVTFESHRFSVADYEIFVQLSSRKPLGETFDLLVESASVRKQDEEDFYHFAVNLVQLGLISLPSPDGKMLYQRSNERRNALRRNALKNFLFHQIPLFNPDLFLDRTIHCVRFIFTKWFVTLWACGVVTALLIVMRRWAEFTDPLADLLTLQDLPLLWCILLGLKVVHEFGHAYACKHFGGNVPAMGLYLIAGNPCAFVDASAAWGFPSRLHRIIVSVGGMYVESIVGVLAVLIWAFSNSPVLASCAHYVVFMATAVTLLFNANPLMKYDGYFILCDLVGSPNLRQRSQNELNGLMKEHLLGLKGAGNRLTLRSLTLVSYGVAASLYKVLVVISISSMVATKFAFLGLLMGGYYVVSTIYKIYSQTLWYLWKSPEVRPVQSRAKGLAYGMLALLPVVLLIPTPIDTRSMGRVTTLHEIAVSNETPGILKCVCAEPGAQIKAEQPIAVLENTAVVSQFELDANALESSLLLHRIQTQTDRETAAKTANQMGFRAAQFELTDQRLEGLSVKAPRHGIVTSCLSKREVGQFLPVGSTIALLGSGPWVIKLLATSETMMASQPLVGQVVRVRLKSQPQKRLAGNIVSIGEAGSRVVNDSLTQVGGGSIPVDPVTREANKSYFEITVQTKTDDDTVLMHGMTAEVGISRITETIGHGIYRRIAKFINQVLTS